jgi:hypothetical protein
MIVQLSIQELRHSPNTVGLGVPDVLHTACDVFGRLFVFGLCGAKFLFDPVVIALGFLRLGHACIEGQTTTLELLPSRLNNDLVSMHI